MDNCRILSFKDMSNKYGHLVPVEQENDVPFQIKRIYYIYGVDKETIRGKHAHRDLHQVLICLKGSVKIKIKTPNNEELYHLNDPTRGLYVGNLIWVEMFDFTKDTLLLVLVSDFYDETDYIRNYAVYLEELKRD